MQDPLEEIIHAPVKIRRLLSSLDFSDEQVVDAAKEQASLFKEASRFRIQKMRTRTQADSELSVLRSSLSLKIRGRLADEGVQKVTEGLVSAKIDRRVEVVKAQKALSKAVEEEEFAKLLLEAFRFRRDALKVVAEVIGAEVYMNRIGAVQVMETGQLSKMKDSLKKKYPGR